jgi:hypothetical protein
MVKSVRYTTQLALIKRKLEEQKENYVQAATGRASQRGRYGTWLSRVRYTTQLALIKRKLKVQKENYV